MAKTVSISSSHNEHFKKLLRLDQTREIHKQGRFLVSGSKIVKEVASQLPHWITAAVVASDDRRGLDFLAQHSFPLVWELEPKLFKELDHVGTHFPLLVCNLPELSPWDPSQSLPGPEVLICQGDPSNVGAAIRTAHGFGARVVLLQEAASPFHPKAIRASSGASLRAPLAMGPSLRSLSLDIKSLIVFDGRGRDLHQLRWPEQARLLIGEEGQGVPEHLKCGGNWLVRIAISDEVESLNAAAALAIGLYSYRLQFPLLGKG